LRIVRGGGVCSCPLHDVGGRCRSCRFDAEVASIYGVASLGRDMLVDVVQSCSVLIGDILPGKSAFVQPEHVARQRRKRWLRRAGSSQTASSHGGQPQTFY
jgi:hypothetical protein